MCWTMSMSEQLLLTLVLPAVLLTSTWTAGRRRKQLALGSRSRAQPRETRGAIFEEVTENA
jgi:hypothetical protein